MRFSQLATTTVLLAAVIGLSACASAEDEDKVESAGFAEHMHGHLDQISAVKSAVIAGDLEATREPARWLAEHEQPRGMPDAWAPYIDEMRMQARLAASAKDLETVAAAVSEMARSCGDCHQASGFAVAFGFDQRPPADVQNVTTQMQRHLWAADRMWDGLIGPSDNAWDWGTEMLSEVTLTSAQITAEPDQETRVDGLVQRIREVGNEGSRAPAGESRSAVYSQFLSLCANCHNLTGGGPAG